MKRCRIGIWSKVLSCKRMDRPFYKFDTQRYYIVENVPHTNRHGDIQGGDVKAIEMFFSDDAKPAEMRCALFRARAVYLANLSKQASAESAECEMEVTALGYNVSEKCQMRVSRRIVKEKSRGLWKGTKHKT